MEYQGIPAGVPVITKEQKDAILDLKEVEEVTLYQSRLYADGIFIRIKAWREAMCWGLTRIIWTYAGIRLSGDADFPGRIMRIIGKWF